MVSHFISSSTGLTQTYRTPSLLSQQSFRLSNNEPVQVLSEFLGNDCSFANVSSSLGLTYVEVEYLKRLPSTSESAPFVCSRQLPNLNYEEPEWFTLPNNEVYFNEKTLKYSIAITTSYFNFASRNDLETQIIDKGIRGLLSYYDKQNDEVTIQKLKDYFIFAQIADIYVSYRRMARIKGLLTVDKKYFDAVPVSQTSQETTPLGNNISDANFILRIPFSELDSLFQTLSNTLKIYNTDIYFSNSKIGITLAPTDVQPFNTAQPILDELSLSEKANDVNKFLDKVKSLLDKNNVPFLNDANDRSKSVIEFAINDECNKIYDISINQQGNCRKLRVGMDRFLKSSPINDPTIVALVKNVYRISKIERCKVPWPEFVETYIYPKVIVWGVSLNDVVQNFEKNRNQYAKDIIQIFNSIQQEGQYYPAKTYEETIEEEIKLGIVKAKTAAFTLLPNTILQRNLYVGDNAVSRQGLDTFFNSLINSIESSTQNYNAYEENITVMLISTLDANNENFVSQFRAVRLVTDYYIQDTGNPTVYQKNQLKLSTPSNPNKKYRIINEDGFDEVDIPLYNPIAQNSKGVKTVQEQINKVYDFLNRFGICKMVDYSLGCTLSLAKDLIDLSGINATITIGVINTFNSQEMIDNVIPFLPQEQQELVYKELLDRTACLNLSQLLFILKRILPEETYQSYGFDTDAFSEIPIEDKIIRINEAVAKLMSTRAQ
jgi:hypothetical protein